jgi:hypothetical protein
MSPTNPRPDWPLQALLIRQNLNALARTQHERISFSSPALKALDEIVEFCRVRICPTCRGQGGTIQPDHRARRNAFCPCPRCSRSGMIVEGGRP